MSPIEIIFYAFLALLGVAGFLSLRELDLGGLLGGSESSGANPLEKANQTPKDRKETLEEADKKGWVQKKIRELISIKKKPDGVESDDIEKELTTKPELEKVEILDSPDGVEVTEKDLKKFD